MAMALWEDRNRCFEATSGNIFASVWKNFVQGVLLKN